MTTSAQQAALEQVQATWAYFIELEFKSITMRLTNFNKSFEWGGNTWIGLGALGDISEIKETEKVEPNPVTMTLTVAQTGWLAFGIGSVEEYRGLPARVYVCPLTPDYQLIDTPMIAWEGEMDVVVVNVEDDGGSISLRCEPLAKRLRRTNALRVNSVQQKARHPEDTSFDYLNDLMANPQLWLSIDFQRSLFDQ